MNTRRLVLALLAATVGLLSVVPSAHAVVRVSPNYQLKSDDAPFRGRDQVALAVNPTDPEHVVAVNANYLDSTCETSTSFDGGDTWSDAVALTPPAPTGPDQAFAKSCTTGVGTSQYVEFGTGQNVYTVAAAQRFGAGFLQDPTVLVYKSTDGGQTWQPGRVAMPGGPGSLDFTSSPNWNRASLSVDPGAGTGQADRIHVTAIEVRGAVCATGRCRPISSVVSNDGGQTFSSPINVTPAETNATDFPSKPVVNSDHSVTVSWRTTGIDGLIQAARSADGGQTWGAPVDVTKVKNTGTSTQTHVPPNPPTTPQPGITSTSASYPRMIGGPSGRIYLVYSQGVGGPTAPDGPGYQGQDHFISPDSQVWFQRSLNNGDTWSQPKKVSDQVNFPGTRTHQTRHPTVSVSPNGRINVVWHDRRHWYQGPGERNCTHSHIFCEEIRLGDTYYSYSTNGGDSFTTPMRINDRSHNNEVGYDTRPSGYWWFGPQSTTVAGDDVLIGWMDSREGNWDTDTEDFYLAKVNFDASGAAPQTKVEGSSAVARSVALSKLAYMGGTEGALVGGARDPANPPGCPAAACPGGPATRNASSVVIVNENDVAGALAGTVLGRANPGPVLLSPASGLPASVKAEVTRMKPAAAFVIGDTSKLSDQVVSELQTLGLSAGQVIRLSGANDAATAAQIAARMDQRTQAEKDANAPAFDAVVIANPDSPDAAAASGLAAARRLPFLFADENSVPAETLAALGSLDIDKTLLIGGSSTVTGAGLPNPTRLDGDDQYETSQSVVNESKARGLPSNVVYAADGSKPMDGALLGGVVARATGMQILAPASLTNTAADQASDFGLNDVQRFFLLTAPATSSQTPPRGYPGPGTPRPPGSLAGCPPGRNLISLTSANDTRNGTAGNDLILAGAGNDIIDALAGDDCVDLGIGRDRGQGGAGNDLVLGGDGVDRLLGNGGNDRVRGGASRDTILGAFGNDALHGQSGNDSVTGSRGRDRINGGSGRDSLGGGSGRDRVSGDAGNDRIAGNSGNDVLRGNSGNDRISGGAGRDRISCGRGRDTVIASRSDRVARDCERVRRR